MRAAGMGALLGVLIFSAIIIHYSPSNILARARAAGAYYPIQDFERRKQCAK